ncbi:MAG: hypothetical protein ACK5OW_00645 [bacterium]|jgi:hypothetical protein
MKNAVLFKTNSLKEFVDFATSLKEMEEVKAGKFPLPFGITYKLDSINHDNLQKEILKQKKLPTDVLYDEFELELYGITFKFIK